jgi:hypothetical protein
MPCKILVSNQSTIAKAEIVEVCSIDRLFSAKESMQSFIDKGGLFENWDRKFSVVIITDKSEEDLSYLNESKESDPFIKKWLFTEPQRDTLEWQDLYLMGQCERSWSVVSQYIVERP